MCRSQAPKARDFASVLSPAWAVIPNFLAYDSEVFVIQDGPREVDGYVWWYLVAPYDETRVGWAAADF